MIVICTDNTFTWRSSLTIDKEYHILRLYNDQHEGYQMVEIKCDDEVIRPYRANRFIFK